MIKSSGKSFGPAPGEAVWTITTKNGQTLQSYGTTAYQACARVGRNLGEVADIRYQRIDE